MSAFTNSGEIIVASREWEEPERRGKEEARSSKQRVPRHRHGRFLFPGISMTGMRRVGKVKSQLTQNIRVSSQRIWTSVRQGLY